MTDPGHNGIEGGRLRAFVERIERLHEERKTLSDDIAEIYLEAKGTGYDTKVMKAIVRRRSQDRDKLREFEEIMDLYLTALREPA